MEKYSSRFGIVSAGKIEAFQHGKSITVCGKKIAPSDSFWFRFSPQVTVTQKPKKNKGKMVKHKLDFTIGYYVVTEGGSDRFVDQASFDLFEPYVEE